MLVHTVPNPALTVVHHSILASTQKTRTRKQKPQRSQNPGRCQSGASYRPWQEWLRLSDPTPLGNQPSHPSWSSPLRNHWDLERKRTGATSPIPLPDKAAALSATTKESKHAEPSIAAAKEDIK
ncbi:hypothetical protein AB1N83_009851 [Pleurotus pulmonarius]